MMQSSRGGGNSLSQPPQPSMHRRNASNLNLSAVDFLGSSLFNIPLGTLKKMKECRKLIIEKLREAKRTFEVIDQNYDSIVSNNAKQINNAYINKAMTDSIKEAKRNLNFLENMHLMKKLDGQFSEIEKDSTELKKYERQNDSFEQGDTKSFTQIMNNFVSDEDEHEVKIRTKIAPINKVSKRSRGKHSQRSNFKLPPSNKSFDKHVKLPKISSKVKFEECKTDQKEKDDINESSLFSEFTRDNLSYKNNQSTQYGKLEESMKKVNEYLDQSIGVSSFRVKEIIKKTSELSLNLQRQLGGISNNSGRISSKEKPLKSPDS